MKHCNWKICVSLFSWRKWCLSSLETKLPFASSTRSHEALDLFFGAAHWDNRPVQLQPYNNQLHQIKKLLHLPLLEACFVDDFSFSLAWQWVNTAHWIYFFLITRPGADWLERYHTNLVFPDWWVFKMALVTVLVWAMSNTTLTANSLARPAWNHKKQLQNIA